MVSLLHLQKEICKMSFMKVNEIKVNYVSNHTAYCGQLLKATESNSQFTELRLLDVIIIEISFQQIGRVNTVVRERLNYIECFTA